MNTITRIALAAALLLPLVCEANGRTGPCKPLPSYVRDAERTLAYCITMQNPIAACGAADVDVQVFNNNERRLPSAGRGQEYYEGKARPQPGAPAGTYRLVYLVTPGQNKQKVEARYYSPDHYTSFCSL